MPDQNSELYRDQLYSPSKARQEATRIQELVGPRGEKDAYSLASDILTAKLEEQELPDLKKQINHAELFFQAEKPFRESLTYFIKQSPIEAPIAFDQVVVKMKKQIEPMLWTNMQVAEDRENRFQPYQEEMWKRPGIIDRVVNRIEKSFPEAYVFSSNEDLETAIDLTFEQMQDELLQTNQRVSLLEDSDRQKKRQELLAQEAVLVEESAFGWAARAIAEFEEIQQKSGIRVRHHWILGAVLESRRGEVQAQTVCTCCGQRLLKTDFNLIRSEQRPIAEWEKEPLSSMPFGKHLVEGSPHRWKDKVIKNRTIMRGHDNIRAVHEGIYRLACVLPTREKVIQNETGQLFVTRTVNKSSYPRVDDLWVELIPTTEADAIKSIKTSDYFHFKDNLGDSLSYRVYDLKPETSLLDILSISPESQARLKAQFGQTETLSQTLPEGLSAESIRILVSELKALSLPKTSVEARTILETHGCPPGLIPYAIRAFTLLAGKAPRGGESSPYFLTRDKRTQEPVYTDFSWFGSKVKDLSLALELAILSHPDYRGPADKLMLLYPKETSANYIPDELAAISKAGDSVFNIHPMTRRPATFIGPNGFWVRNFSRAIAYISNIKPTVNVKDKIPVTGVLPRHTYLDDSDRAKILLQPAF